MTSAEAALSLDSASFEEIERAVMQTERGRWFLAEHARRARAADTARILAAIARLEASHARPAATQVHAANDTGQSTPIEQLMQRLTEAMSDVNAASGDHGPATMAEIDLLSPADRMRLFL